MPNRGPATGNSLAWPCSTPAAWRRGLYRRLLFEAKRCGRRNHRHHGFHESAVEIPNRNLPHRILRRSRCASHEIARCFRRHDAARSGNRPEELARVPLEAVRDTRDSHRMAQRRVSRPVVVPAPRREPVRRGRATSSLSSKTIALRIFSCNAQTIPGTRTTNGPASTRCTRTPRETRSRADVSFDRPYGRYAQFTSVVNDPLSVGAGEWLSFEFPLSYFLEQHGYDVSYVSNSDMVTPERVERKSFISVGHDEYWDRRQYDSVVKMRDSGVNLLFLSGNAVCWVTPLCRSRWPSRSGHVPRRTLWR